MMPVCARMCAKPLLFSVCSLMREKMPNLLQTSLFPLPILLCACSLYKRRRTGQSPENAGRLPKGNLCYETRSSMLGANPVVAQEASTLEKRPSLSVGARVDDVAWG